MAHMATTSGNMVNQRFSKYFSKKYRRKKSRRTEWMVFAAMLILFGGTGGVAAVNLLQTQSQYVSAQQEYARLRQFVPTIASEQRNSSRAEEELTSSAEQAAVQGLPINLSDINPDYAGWIRIKDTAIDYPVVRGQDNGQYLETSFSGSKNPSGTIFIDSRCRQGFDGCYVILHGHNMKDKSMFAGLNLYLDKDYLAKHPEIMVITPQNKMQVYEIIDVKVTDIYDPAYLLTNKSQQEIMNSLNQQNVVQGGDLALQSMSDEARQILILSTCTNRSNKDERLLIFAKAL